MFLFSLQFILAWIITHKHKYLYKSINTFFLQNIIYIQNFEGLGWLVWLVGFYGISTLRLFNAKIIFFVLVSNDMVSNNNNNNNNFQVTILHKNNLHTKNLVSKYSSQILINVLYTIIWLHEDYSYLIIMIFFAHSCFGFRHSNQILIILNELNRYKHKEIDIDR